MKKLFALLLALALLIPMGLVSAVNAEGEVTAEPFYMLGWSDFDQEKYPYIDGLVTSNFATKGDNATISYSDAKITYNKDGLNDADVTKFAENLKTTMDKRPEGTRYWHTWAPGKVLSLNPENVIYLDYGVDQMAALVTAILKKYKELDGKLDGIVVDTEYIHMSSYYIYTEQAKKDGLVYKRIVDDPRYATEVRPLLAERNFQFYPSITDYTPEIYSIDQTAGTEYNEARSIWDTVMRNRLSTYLNKWAYEPLKTYFPEASLSDYQTIDSKPWLKQSAVTDSGEILTGGNSYKAGTAGSYSFYMANPGDAFYRALNKYASYNDASYEASPFNSLLCDINFAKHMYLSNPLRQIAPWITHYDYKRYENVNNTWSVIDSAYYSEQIYHLGMLDPEPFLAYMYRLDNPIKGDALKFDERSNVLNELMAELTRVAGFSDRKPVEMAPYWNSEFILSGMYANGRNIWRITPNIDEVSLENFKVEGKDLTFAVKGQTVTFPGGKIIEDTAITHVGSCGYWVETAKDVTPVITNDADRYDKFPALLYDFEDVAEGKYDYNNHKPLTAWEFTWKKGATTTIEKIGENKVLAMNGTVSLRSAKLPAKVTAGDTYAENQSWEITVTIPEGLAAEAQIVLLNYVGTSQKVKDGGFKIENGKLYYSALGTDGSGKQIQEYKELMDITPGTYTFNRAMDFNNGEAFVSSYYVYDATGKELKSCPDVSVPTYATITTIEFNTKDTGDKPVYLDNYKLAVTGTAADFELYDATHGVLVKDDARDTPRGSTAYRLSWMNASAKEETATVMAAYYEGQTLKEEKVIQEVKMAPGYDNVETGVVEVAEGQTVKVYLKTSFTPDAPAAPTTPTEPTTAPTVAETTSATEAAPTDGGEKGGSTGIVIAVIAIVAVVAIGVVLVVIRKKPGKK